MKFTLSTAFTPVSHIPSLAITADQTGWDMVTFSDHCVNPETLTTPYPYTADGSRRWPEFTDWPDPMVMMGALATITQRIRFTTNAFVLPIRNPFLVAKAASTVAVLSNNRLTLTVGLGWSKDEYGLLQQDFHTRGKRCDEMIEIMRLLWSGQYVEYHGEHYDFPRVEMNPPVSQHIPVWIAGISEPALRRAARIGDGWLTDLQPVDEIVDSIQRIHDMRTDLGRQSQPFDVMASPSDAFGVDAYRRLEDQGVTHILMQPWQIYHPGTQDLQQQQDSIRRFADEIIAHCS